MSQLIRDTVAGDLRLVESKERRRPGVLAVVEGTFFVADKPSRNGRIYPRKLWENVLSSSDFKRMLNNRLLFGTVGHAEEQLDDLIRDGKVSHVVTEVSLLPDGRGIGKAEILDTPAGRVLKTLFESGSKLSVSSKAYGDYEGQTSEGHWRVSPSSFVLERFDFVVDPGFLEAQPTVKEVYESVVRAQGSSNDVLSKLIDEKSKHERRIAQLLRDVEVKEKELKELKEKVEKFDRLRNGILEKEIERIGDILVERFGVDEKKIASDSVLGVVRNIRRVIESLALDRGGQDEGEPADLDDVEHEISDQVELDSDGDVVDDVGFDDDVGLNDEDGDVIEVPVDIEVDDEDVDDIVSDVVSKALRRRRRVRDCRIWDEGDEVYGVGEFEDGKVYVAGKRLSNCGKIYLVAAVVVV